MATKGYVKGIVRPGTNKLEAKVDGYDMVINFPAENYEPEGPIPGGVLAFALAGCKALVCSTYFNARGKDVQVEVEVSSDFGRDEKTKYFQTSFDVNLKFSGDVKASEIEKIKKILDQECAIEHILLGDKNKVTTHYQLAE